MDGLETIEYAVIDGYAEIRFDRPDVLNAFNERMYTDLNLALETAQADDSVYAILLTGNGKAYSAGRDLNQDPPESKFQYRRYLWKAVNAQRLLYEGPKPSIAAINGPALGAGFAYAIVPDFRIMSTEALLNDQHVNVGLAPGLMARLFCQLVGESRAKQYLMTGRDITSSDADRLGLAMEVTEPDRLMTVARDLAVDLVNLPAEGLRQTKAMASLSPYGEMERELERHWSCMQDPEHERAAKALRSGNSPEFDR
jgi:enoyl-CoA hydratase/carnithine racemase